MTDNTQHIIASLQALLAQGKDTALLRFSLGNAYLKTQQYPLAIEHLAQALRQDAQYSAAWKCYGKALAENEQPDAAINAYQQGIKVAETKGDIQAAKEMRVFLKRIIKHQPTEYT